MIHSNVTKMDLTPVKTAAGAAAAKFLAYLSLLSISFSMLYDNKIKKCLAKLGHLRDDVISTMIFGHIYVICPKKLFLKP